MSSSSAKRRTGVRVVVDDRLRAAAIDAGSSWATGVIDRALKYRELVEAARALVEECSPEMMPGDRRRHGVKMPSIKARERLRALLPEAHYVD